MADRALIIDSFAGGGGASTGIEIALGRSPDVAINHSAAALALHAANHPDTVHLDSNIWDVEPQGVVLGRKVGLLWASPDCKHFSKAKGGALLDRNIRDLAWVVVKWAEEAKPDVIILENVEEFRTWGPVGEDGQPIRELAGITFEAWAKRLKRTGYKVQHRELRACDYGAPTIRKRLFLVARRDGRPIVWPAPTHGAPDSPEVRAGRRLPWRTAAECIDWSLPCPSIFETAEEIHAKHGLRAKRPLARNTLARVARGMKRYVLDAERPFLVNLTHGGRCEDAAEPIRTITGAHRGEKAVVAPSLLSLKGSDRRDSPATAPHPTVLAGGGHSALVAPALAINTTGHPGAPLDRPAPTVVTGGHHAVVAPVLTYAQQGGHNRPADAPLHTVTASRKDQNALLLASLIQTGYGERPGQAPRVLDLDRPLGTVVAAGAKHAVCAAWLAQHNNDSRRIGGVNPGRPAGEPLSTLTSTGSQQGLSAAWLAKWYGSDQDPRLGEPLHTVTTRDRFDVETCTLVVPPFSAEHEARAREVAEFLREHGAWDGGEFVTLEIRGATFVVVDIGMRMLTPRELYRAQGFPEDYVIEGVWRENKAGEWAWHPFPKDVQIGCVGNSVCPPIAAALVGANCQHLSETEEREAAHG